MRLRALIFDDEAVMRQLLWTLCDQRGYEVFTFPDPGLCPLHIFTSCPCPTGSVCADIVISDINMMHVNGLDFVEGLLNKHCHAPHIALMSGAWTDADLARAARLGCTLFAKPFRSAEIMAWLERVEAMISPNRRLIAWRSHELGAEWMRENDTP
jgi:DNA-binding response OmpR family regulator